MRNWFAHYPGAIAGEEQFFEGNEGDLVSLLTKRRSPFVSFLTSFKPVRARFRLSKRSDRVDLPEVIYASATGLETFATVSILIAGLVLCFGSIWWLNFVVNNVYRLAIITTSASLFTIWAWIAAGNRPFEILAAFAAYVYWAP